MIRNRLRFGEKVLLLVMGVSMLITIGMSLLFYRESAVTLQDKYRDIQEENVRNRADYFYDLMKEAYLTSVYAATEQEVLSLMRQGDTEKLIPVLQSFQIRNDEFHSLYCFIEEKDLLIRVGKEITQIIPADETIRSWLSELQEAAANTPPLSPLVIRDTPSVIQHNFFTYFRTVYTEEGTGIGSIMINIDERQINYKCLNRNSAQDGDIYLLKDGKIVSSEDVNKIGETAVLTEDVLTVGYDTAEKGFRVTAVIDRNSLLDDLKKTRNRILLTAVLLNLILSIPIFLGIRQLLRPLRQLDETVNHVREGDLSVRAEIYQSDEIGRLSRHFNDMLDQIESLIDELVAQKMLKREAEIEALQYQIRPHFMYNTLSAIRYAAIFEHADDIAELLQAFTELLRMSASDRGAFITVKEEMH